MTAIDIHPKLKQIPIWWDKIQVEVYVYFFKGSDYTVIDTGPPQIGRNAIGCALKSENLTLADINLILNTHGHEDHAGDDSAIKEISRAKVYIHRDDAFFLENTVRSYNEYYGPPIMAVRGKERFEGGRETFLSNKGTLVTVDRYLEDNELIDIGNGIGLRIIHLPGHSPGSAGFYWEKEGILISGDAVSGLHNTGGDLPIITDFTAYEKSVRRLLELPLQLLLCSHPYRGRKLPPCAVRRGTEIRQFLQDSIEVAQSIYDMTSRVYKDVHGSFLEMADTIITRLPEEMGFKPPSRLISQRLSMSPNTIFWCLRNQGLL